MKKTINIFIKKMKMYFKTNVLISIFILTNLINTVILRYNTVANPLDIRPLLLDLVFLIVIASFAYFFKPKKQFGYLLSASIFIVFLCVLNSIYYRNFISFTSVTLIATSSQVADVADAVYKDIFEIKDLIYLWQIAAIVYVYINLKKKNYFDTVKKYETRRIRFLNSLLASLILFGFFLTTLTGVDVSRLEKQWNREFIVMRYGIIPYHINDIVTFFRAKVNSIFGYDEAYKNFREFYSVPKENKENKYTNIYKGKNIISIHAESIQNFTLGLKINGKEVTPNLNRISKEGIYFSNFYAQESIGTSSDTEFTLNTSLLPVNSGTVFVNYHNRDYLTIPKLLAEQGYSSYSMHGNKGAFWNRNVMHKSLGYNKFFYHTKDYKIDETIGLGLSDKSFFRQSLPKLKEIHSRGNNFYATLIMLTNHTPFTDIVEKNVVDFDLTMPYISYNEETGLNENLVAPYLVGTKMEGYLKSVNYADAAIGELIDNLRSEGMLDDTVILIYGDHDAKLKKSDYNLLYNYDPVSDSIKSKDEEGYIEFDFYKKELLKKVPLIVWSDFNKNSKEVKKIMGMSDVLPTLGNMFGFSSKYALGNDIFSIDKNIVVFPSGNWLTDDMYYNNQKSEGKLLDSSHFISVEEIEKNNEYAQKVLTVSESIILFDLIAKEKEKQELNKIYGN